MLANVDMNKLSRLGPEFTKEELLRLMSRESHQRNNQQQQTVNLLNQQQKSLFYNVQS